MQVINLLNPTNLKSLVNRLSSAEATSASKSKTQKEQDLDDAISELHRAHSAGELDVTDDGKAASSWDSTQGLEKLTKLNSSTISAKDPYYLRFRYALIHEAGYQGAISEDTVKSISPITKQIIKLGEDADLEDIDSELLATAKNIVSRMKAFAESSGIDLTKLKDISNYWRKLKISARDQVLESVGLLGAHQQTRGKLYKEELATLIQAIEQQKAELEKQIKAGNNDSSTDYYTNYMVLSGIEDNAKVKLRRAKPRGDSK